MLTIIAVHLGGERALPKVTHNRLSLVANHGVEGDRHAGPTRRHRARFRPTVEVPNLRQVHLIQSELFADLAAKGFAVAPGDMGENVTTAGIDLLALPTGTRLRLGDDAVVELTGLRTPCFKLDRWQPGLKMATVERGARNRIILKAGVMAIVVGGGEVRAGDAIEVELPPEPHARLKPV